jgi:hypothetical protein
MSFRACSEASKRRLVHLAHRLVVLAQGLVVQLAGGVVLVHAQALLAHLAHQVPALARRRALDGQNLVALLVRSA